MSVFDKAAKLGIASEDAYNQGGWLPNFVRLLNEWVAEGVTSDPHDFIGEYQNNNNGLDTFRFLLKVELVFSLDNRSK